MRWQTSVIGALTIFGRSAVTFGPAEVRVLQSLAGVATIAILQERGIAQSAVVTAQIETALSGRLVVEQATGVLSRLEGIPVEEAFGLLRRRASTDRTRLVDVARAVLDEDPGSPVV
jgi:AmiR/NasT family two-component response regulator